MSIVAINITKNEVQGTQRFLDVTFVDHTGGEHRRSYAISTLSDVGTFTQSEAFSLDVELATREEQDFMDAVLAGQNPKTDNLKFVSSAKGIKSALRELLSRTPDVSWMAGADWALGLTDAQLSAALDGVDIALVKARLTLLKDAAQLLRVYTPSVTNG